jgi:hypothetical protein
MTLTPLAVPLSEGRWTPGDHNLDGLRTCDIQAACGRGAWANTDILPLRLDPTSELRTRRTDYRRAQGFKSLAVNEPLALRADEQAGSYDSSVRLVPANAHLVSA